MKQSLFRAILAIPLTVTVAAPVAFTALPAMAQSATYPTFSDYMATKYPSVKQPTNNCGVGYLVTTGTPTPEQKATLDCLAKLRAANEAYDAQLGQVKGQYEKDYPESLNPGNFVFGGSPTNTTAAATPPAATATSAGNQAALGAAAAAAERFAAGSTYSALNQDHSTALVKVDRHALLLADRKAAIGDSIAKPVTGPGDFYTQPVEPRTPTTVSMGNEPVFGPSGTTTSTTGNQAVFGGSPTNTAALPTPAASSLPAAVATPTYPTFSDYMATKYPSVKQPTNNCGVGYLVTTGTPTPEQKATLDCLAKLRAANEAYDAQLGQVKGQYEKDYPESLNPGNFVFGGSPARN